MTERKRRLTANYTLSFLSSPLAEVSSRGTASGGEEEKEKEAVNLYFSFRTPSIS